MLFRSIITFTRFIVLHFTCYGELVILRLPAVEIEAAIGIPHLIGRRHLHSFQKVRKRPDDGDGKFLPHVYSLAIWATPSYVHIEQPLHNVTIY